MSTVKTFFKKYRSYVGVGSLAILALFTVFSAGIVVGHSGRPEIDRAEGIYNKFLASTSNSAGTVKVGADGKFACVDSRGATVPCEIGGEGHTASSTPDEPADFGQYWKVWNLVNDRFVPHKGKIPTNQEKVWGSIAGLANSLGDPYTYFMPPQEKTIFQDDVSGNFGGVGMQVGMRNGIVTVIAPLKDSPAEKAGVKKGDKVLKIDNATTTDMTVDKAVYLIRGKIGTKVHLTLYREEGDKLYEVDIVREVIQTPTIETEARADGIYVIKLFGFPATGADLFRDALKKFIDSGDKKLVLDLRGNPGGYLEVAVDIGSWFLPEGKVIVREEEKSGTGQIFRSKGYDVRGKVFENNLKMVILVDEGSASAAEILAGALSEHGVATLVGKKTFGKGSVQELIPVTEDTAIKMTVARWLTPNGRSLSEGGIDPDVAVSITREEIEAGKDPQMEKAIEVLKK